MDDGTTDMFSEAYIEILPPDHIDQKESAICVCCCRQRPNSAMDEDGCGICDECLAP
ncbi:hypothetical protein N7E02_06595 (plasmid) [Aliirhizobium terrae]|uniref:hypothetical protein n=1 Tax=Terrirhizobium terrae TaxID=2926709 RepID=UPI00257667C8|nr:hypothetical protein [Rhizobium sp. CC-CFT758]WJH38313.1 hypothetical protein N7E02_06595 [Rhizobium sp. CC-CFT758]